MNTVSFQNKGLIDVLSIKTFGVSAKDCEDPIGFFGTGLKYAIAILLRNKCAVTINRGHEEFVFTARTEVIRGKDFEIVHMNDEPLSFTLELGKTWEMWQAFRELYCNMLDEGGVAFGNRVPPEEECTTIIVDGIAFYHEYVNRYKILLASKPAFIESKVEVHDVFGGNIHYQGVRVGQFERPSIFTYNITGNLRLTEDRTINDISDVNTLIRQAVFHSDDRNFIEKFITAPEETYESTVDMNWFENPSELFLNVLDETPFKKVHNSTVRTLLHKHKEKLKAPVSVATMTDIEKQQLDRASKFCLYLNYSVTDYTVHVTDDLKEETLGMAYEGEIYIARRTFMMGTKMVAATLLEEFIHLDRGLHDNTYAMQNFLFEKIVSMGEQLRGEAL